jgi:hypothetical protein
MFTTDSKYSVYGKLLNSFYSELLLQLTFENIRRELYTVWDRSVANTSHEMSGGGGGEQIEIFLHSAQFK